MRSSPCPFCRLTFPASQLQRHANDHLEEEELRRDMELAREIAIAPTSPPKTLNNPVEHGMLFETSSGKTYERSSSRSDESSNCSGEMSIDEKVFHLARLQIRSTFYRVEDGLMALLRNCLESELGNSTCILSGSVIHFQSIESEDVGWGCGWRNIQMLSSHLVMQRQEARQVLFGGSGFIPDIPSLQRWLEIAWERDFDTVGSEHFNHKIYGTTNWIGTTECAALFRSFGLRARIVDFGPKEIKSPYPQKNSRGKRKADEVCGPIDKFLLRREPRDQDISQPGSSRHDLCNLADSTESDKCFTRNDKGRQVLVDWVWNYFSDNKFAKSGSHDVIVTDKAPLYFQHDGHSRTIVGIQVKHQLNGMHQYNLLILDPTHKTAALERSLKENVGWQKFIKRGVHTLKKLQYQLCHIDPGIAHAEELEQLKTLDSIFLEF